VLGDTSSAYGWRGDDDTFIFLMHALHAFHLCILTSSISFAQEKRRLKQVLQSRQPNSGGSKPEGIGHESCSMQVMLPCGMLSHNRQATLCSLSNDKAFTGTHRARIMAPRLPALDKPPSLTHHDSSFRSRLDLRMARAATSVCHHASSQSTRRIHIRGISPSPCSPPGWRIA